MTPTTRPARTGIQTCKENIGIAGREPNARSEKHRTYDDKGPYRSALRCGAIGLYTAGSSSEAIFLWLQGLQVPARVATCKESEVGRHE